MELHNLKPYNLSTEEEQPFKVIPDAPFISENYAFYAYDFEKHTGYVAYVGRWVKNPKIWREQLFIYLPDGSVLAHMRLGPAPDGVGPSGGSMRFKHDPEKQTWRISFDGAMRHASYDEYRNEPINEGRPQPVTFEVLVDSKLPVVMMPPSKNTTFGNSHYEQMGTGVGSVNFGGKRYDFSGLGYRDHSRGPRQLGSLEGHLWLQLFFPEGPAFTAYHVWVSQEGKLVQALDKTLSVRPDGFGEASLATALRLPSIDTVLDPMEIDVTVEGKHYHLRTKPIVPPLLTSFNGEVDFFFGYTPSLGEFVGTEYPLMFEYEGGQVPGYMQRSTRIARS